MGSFLRPVGPLPLAVYWRRRILLVGIPLVLIGVLINIPCQVTHPNPSDTIASERVVRMLSKVLPDDMSDAWRAAAHFSPTFCWPRVDPV